MTRPAPVLFLHVATQYVITDILSFVNNAAAFDISFVATYLVVT